MAKRIATVIASVVASGMLGLAQSIPTPPGPNAPAFEVASVKHHARPGDPSTIETQPGGRFSAISMTPFFLITQAYRLRSFQVMNGPGWISAYEFDVIAKAPDGTPPDRIAAMLRSLLSERFKLKGHVESREMPVYELVLERPGADPSPKLRRSAVDCDVWQATTDADPFGALSADNRKAILDPTNVCRERLSARVNNGAMVLDMVIPGASMTALARRLSGYANNRLVIDRTGLSGRFDVALNFDPAALAAPAVGAGDRGPSILTALQEQLGLRLRSERAQVDVLVIDNIEQPTPD